jgi:hypothetical protein
MRIFRKWVHVIVPNRPENSKRRPKSKAYQGSGSLGWPLGLPQVQLRPRAFQWADQGACTHQQSSQGTAQHLTYRRNPECQSGSASGSASRFPMGWPGSLHPSAKYPITSHGNSLTCGIQSASQAWPQAQPQHCVNMACPGSGN